MKTYHRRKPKAELLFLWEWYLCIYRIIIFQHEGIQGELICKTNIFKDGLVHFALHIDQLFDATIFRRNIESLNQNSLPSECLLAQCTGGDH